MPRTKKPDPPAADRPRVASVPARYDPKTLVGVYRWCRDNPTGRVEVRGYAAPTFTATEWLSWFRRQLDRKITAADPRPGFGRKHRPEYDLELARLRPYVGTRLAVRPHDRDWRTLGRRVYETMSARFPDDAPPFPAGPRPTDQWVTDVYTTLGGEG